MKRWLLFVATVKICGLLLAGCRQAPDTDVTDSAKYNFSSFAGTVWKSKVEIVLIDLKHYTGEHVIDLTTRDIFDPTNLTNATAVPVPNAREIGVLPIGTQLQIGRLMEDNGNWGGVRVTVKLVGNTNYQQAIYIGKNFLADNQFLSPGSSSSKAWGINEKVLEK